MTTTVPKRGKQRLRTPPDRLRVRQLLAARHWTIAELVRRSDGHLAQSTAYRLADDAVSELSLAHVALLCRVFELSDAGQLFAIDPERPDQLARRCGGCRGIFTAEICPHCSQPQPTM